MGTLEDIEELPKKKDFNVEVGDTFEEELIEDGLDLEEDEIEDGIDLEEDEIETESEIVTESSFDDKSTDTTSVIKEVVVNKITVNQPIKPPKTNIQRID
jgi:hypothetical protein